MSKKRLSKNEFLERISEFLTIADVLAADAISDVSVAIIRKRIAFGMTQKEFAKYIGVSQGMISKWENGDYNFTLRAIAEICEKLDLQMNLKLEEYAPVPGRLSTEQDMEQTAEFCLDLSALGMIGKMEGLAA